MALDLLLIHPMAAHGITGDHPVYGSLGSSLIAVEQPLWCRLIAGYVRDRGHSVRIIDAEALRWEPDKVALECALMRPRLVAIAVFGHQPSASTQQMDGAGQTARRIKTRWPEAKIMMLGGHVSALPERTMREEQIDFACVGEGPVTIHEFLKNPYNRMISGLVYRGNTGIIINERARLLDCNEMHGTTWDLLPMEEYQAHNWQCFGSLDKRKPYASIYTSLGCSFKCSFCCINAPFDTNRYRMRSPGHVVSEVRHLIETYGVRTFKIIDEMFVLNEKHYTAIAESLAELNRNDDLNFWAYARVDTVKPHTLKLLRRAGIKWLALGIESGSKYVRDGSNKRLKNDDITQVVWDIQAADINVIGNYIFGLPDDNLDSMRETLDLALSLNTEFANFYSAMAYPGSPLYTEALTKGWNLPETWAGFSQHNKLTMPLATQYISSAQVLKFRDEAFQIYYSNPQYQAMIMKKFGADTLIHIKQMLTYKLERNLLSNTFVPAEKASAH